MQLFPQRRSFQNQPMYRFHILYKEKKRKFLRTSVFWLCSCSKRCHIHRLSLSSAEENPHCVLNTWYKQRGEYPSPKCGTTRSNSWWVLGTRGRRRFLSAQSFLLNQAILLSSAPRPENGPQTSSGEQNENLLLTQLCRLYDVEWRWNTFWNLTSSGP